MKVFQQLAATCSCSVCRTGCLCGDCEACSNPRLERSLATNAKRVSALACLVIVLGGFVFFAPVVALGASPAVTETVSLRFQPSTNSTSPLGSISFCLLGQGAVLVNGTYYPAVALNQTARRICSTGVASKA
ncbi:MAG: hypothetical protein JRM80_00495 [Nitrososphaerota archaeon]|nr:hypothetical protein [Nitrososphaerota archaeon]